MSSSEEGLGNMDEQASTHRGERLLLIMARISCYLPVIWLALFFVFVLAVALQVGHLPTYGQPDPKDAGAASILYLPVIGLLLFVLAMIPISVGLAVMRLVRGVPQAVRAGEAIAYLVGIGLLLLLVIYDFAGLVTWLGD